MAGSSTPSPSTLEKAEELSRLRAAATKNFLSAAQQPEALPDPLDRPLSHEAEVALQLAGKATRALNKTTVTLARIAAGAITYGICEDCGETIPKKRLEAIPQTTRCIECQTNAENAKIPLRRVRQITTPTSRYL